jgi:protoheme IX farnesyltransferase
MVALAAKVFVNRDGEAAVGAARRLFGFSILYLFAVFAALLAERVLGIGAFAGLFS